jgi:hypothetical protein
VWRGGPPREHVQVEEGGEREQCYNIGGIFIPDVFGREHSQLWIQDLNPGQRRFYSHGVGPVADDRPETCGDADSGSSGRRT